jgi:uncharacterized protein YbcV (DUF1398 family)
VHRRERRIGVAASHVRGAGHGRASVILSGSTVGNDGILRADRTHKAVACIVGHNGVEQALVQVDVELTRSGGRHLSKDQVLRHTTAIVELSERSSLQQNFNCLFERTTHERTIVGTVDTVTSNRSQITTNSHDIDQQSQVTVVNVRTVKGKHEGQFAKHSCTGSLNTEYFENLNKLVGVSA